MRPLRRNEPGTPAARYLELPRPRAFAHRGWHIGEWDGLENTLAAMRAATDHGYRYIEIDVHATRDGVVIVHHDETLARVAGSEGSVRDLSWDQLADVRVNGREAVTRLDTALRELPEARFNIDIKSDSAVKPFVATIDAVGARDRVSIASFSTRRLHRLRRLFSRGGGLPAAALTRAGVAAVWACSRLAPPLRPPRWLLAKVAWGHMAQVPLRYAGRTVVDRRFVELCHDLGIEVHAWTINDAPEMHRLLDLGLDGIVTDRPDTLDAVLAERARRQH
ncbi:glycerophosphodiester phosphodiesterase [Hoyosella sp. G463]|uniref:Glycerophosphodiester phosphodiesterase n=1 Tax=Lolliginicoccus lacisalsi TaxID=2742202 RepID=A0A927PN71_9ACTN|nr:glycerophosphodiester phosphodiesterase family protein [Lolliginicoccus lacisalsi]MBD8507682.1 glycerophosphodiester phosphodiesterase [Lolliginicoccus lacisalsi]